MSERPAAVRSAIVLGGSLAGMLAARALAGFVDEVTVVERDALPERPGPRRGLPQARHAHMLWSGGAQAVEELVPGTTERLLAAGAHRQAVTTDMVILSPQGWYRRWPVSHHNLLAGRDLLDATVRMAVLADDRVELLERTEVLGLVGGEAAVTGVRVRQDDGTERVLEAGLVVDATGRSSRAPHWLAALGLPEPEKREVDSGLAYASRVFRAPEGARRGFPVVAVQADARRPGPGRSAFLVPIEDGRWIVMLSGTRGGEPSPDNDDFVRYAREELRHPLIGELIAGAEPLGDVAFTRSTANRRWFYERMSRRPENFAVIGDALAVYNPVYGHGMAVAAQSALALRDVIRRQGWGSPGLARRIQKAVARPVGVAWDLATGQDVFYEGATQAGPTRRDRLVAAYVDRLLLTATGNGRIARRLTDVTSLERGPEVLLTPGVLLAAAAGPLRPRLEEAPLTPEERRAAGL
ncbi:pyridine nucleotide-disulfide oxidoreductase [Streptomyces europaeiscabiei]|uniref:NAD(P)/FAD-dependent oxidoreductase n=1 Tax=Streptomyces europaeiscabiei TaxID=146819 RepID=UPI000ABE3236|nr:pyridine nucleotide-disulfide oxidoreductase [Streptomyces europaeiscabiei]MDX2773466.1 pyridine nucleotide-disulfide oxidoreductase [Streptomyces europaeiscabiei]MDX3666523.1 pyridine nucleotide-disulfide oxidoreductase [Streptomyces europaeiscabiei]MDX3711495.1 pyridine nucleotide-disulfide oxidoreductase [Streptomyces europaeiscabiei]